MGYGTSTKFMIHSIPTNGKNAIINTIEQLKNALPLTNRFSVFDEEIEEDERLDLLKELPLFDLAPGGCVPGHVWRQTVLTNPKPVRSRHSKAHWDYKLRRLNGAFDDFDQDKAKADFINEWVEDLCFWAGDMDCQKNLDDMPWLLAEAAGCEPDVVDNAYIHYMAMHNNPVYNYITSPVFVVWSKPFST